MRCLIALALCCCAPLDALRLDTPRTIVELEAEVGPPYELGAVVLTLDGEVLTRSWAPLVLQLAPGPHQVAVAAALTRPCELGAERIERTRVRAVESFTVSDRQPHIVVRLYADIGNSPALEAELDGVAFSAVVAEPGCCTELAPLPALAFPEPSDARTAAACEGRSGESVLVRGEVRKPGQVVWRAGLTAFDAISAAGGGTRRANLGYTEVQRYCGPRLLAFTLPWHESVTALELKPGDDVIVRMTPEP